MPPKAAAQSLAAMLDSDQSDLEAGEGDQKSNQENAAPAKKDGKAAAATSTAKKVRKPKPASKRLSGGRPKKAASAAAAARKRRTPLKDKSNEPQEADEDTEEVDEFADQSQNTALDIEPEDEKDDEVDKVPAKRKRGRPAKKAKESHEQDQVPDQDSSAEIAPAFSKQKRGLKSNTSAGQRKATTRSKVVAPAPAPAPEPEPDLDESAEAIEEAPELAAQEADEEELEQTIVVNDTELRVNPRQARALAWVPRKRAASVSDSERGDAPVLRRKLNDTNKRYEVLQRRYDDLQTIGIEEAEVNFEKLKEASIASEKAASELIESLKTELAAIKKENADSKAVQARHGRAAEEKSKVWEERCSTAEAALAGATEKLVSVQGENKALHARLAATRQASHEPPMLNGNGSRVPGSAAKGKAVANSAALAAQTAVAQLKEDLYSDLTGLILRGVERRDGEDVYDCIQTGRNGTLHFRLSIDKRDVTASYEETEFQYTPRLEHNRDRDLFEILPDYLAEEITFSRANAATFYSRICDTLTRKPK